MADEFHRPDVDPQLQRSGGHHRPDLAGAEAPLGFEARLPREAAVVGEHGVRAEPLAQFVGHSLGHAAGVHEDQRGPVLPDQVGDPVPDVLHHFVGSDRPQLGSGNLDAEVEPAPPADGDDFRAAVARAEEGGDLADRLHGGREPDALQSSSGGAVETLEGQRQVAAPFVPGERVDLVHDHRPRGGEQGAAAGRGEEEVERFRCGDEEVRRPAGHPGALRRRGVPGAERGADFGEGR